MTATYQMTLDEFRSQFTPVLANTFYPKWVYNGTEHPCKTPEQQAVAYRIFHMGDILDAINNGSAIPDNVRREYPELSDLFD